MAGAAAQQPTMWIRFSARSSPTRVIRSLQSRVDLRRLWGRLRANMRKAGAAREGEEVRGRFSHGQDWEPPRHAGPSGADHAVNPAMLSHLQAAVWIGHQEARIFHVEPGTFDESMIRKEG
jgi:hypothetical protein